MDTQVASLKQLFMHLVLSAKFIDIPEGSIQSTTPTETAKQTLADFAVHAIHVEHCMLVSQNVRARDGPGFLPLYR